MKLTAAVVDRTNGKQPPKLQIWRENDTHPGLFFKPGVDVPIVNNNSVCADRTLEGGIFRCTLEESFQVRVIPGDILGIELPPTNDVDLDIEFMAKKDSSTQINHYIFNDRLNSTVNIAQAINMSGAGDEMQLLPQITVLVVLGVLSIRPTKITTQIE